MDQSEYHQPTAIPSTSGYSLIYHLFLSRCAVDRSPLGSNMYTYLKFGLPRVFPPNVGSQRSHRAGPGPGPGKGYINQGYRDSSGPGAGSSGYDSSDNETTRGRVPATQNNIRKFRSESDFRTLGMSAGHNRPASHLHPGNNVPMSALRQAHSRASIAGTHLHHQYQQSGARSGKHYGNRSHSEADLLGGGGMGHDTVGREYQHRLQNQHLLHEAPLSTLAPSRRQSAAAMGLIYPNIQVHCLDVESGLKGVSLQAKAGDLFAVMATSSREGTALLEVLAGLKERMAGEILINGQRISQHGLRNLCSYVPAPDRCSLDPRMSVQSTLNFYATLCGPSDSTSCKQQVGIGHARGDCLFDLGSNFPFSPADKSTNRRPWPDRSAVIEHFSSDAIGEAALVRRLSTADASNDTDFGPNHNQHGHL